MYEVSSPLVLELMPLLPKVRRDLWFRILLPRKNENNIPLLILQRHSVGEGILSRRPPHINTQGFIHPHPRSVKSLMAQRSHHPPQLRFRPLARHHGNQTEDSWHLSGFLAGFLHRLNFSADPIPAPLQEFVHHGLRQTIHQPVMQPHPECRRSQKSQWHVISRNIHSLESIHFLEIAQPVVLFVSILKILINKMPNATLRAKDRKITRLN